jgi:polyvinyl alcohol dehydrogenase (cytochrome)
MGHRFDSFLLLLLVILAIPTRGFAQDGQAVYRLYCASCHEASAQTRAPARDVLRQLTAERILDALEANSGPMFRQGLARTPAERRALALYLSGKPFGTEKPLDLDRIGCKAADDFTDPLSAPGWNGWSVNPSNARFQSAAAAGLDAKRVPGLKLKWAFAYPGDIIAFSQPTVVSSRVFVGSSGRGVYALDAATGCVRWAYTADTGVRSAITIGPLGSSKTYAAFFGDLAANAYAVDAGTGKQLWKVNLDSHHAARITGAPTLYEGRLYVPVASLEEVGSGMPDYECCTFRGSVVALDAATGKEIWKTYTISEKAHPVSKNKIGVQQWGPSGAAVWSSPTLDVDHKILYVATGDNYSLPPSKTSDAVMALDMGSGKVLWVRQLTEKDAFNTSCYLPDSANCPPNAGPDFDFGSSAILIDLPNGRHALIAGQKSGVVHALDPDREAKTIWQARVGQGGIVGGILWGPAADEKNVYAALSDAQFDENHRISPTGGGGLVALRLTDGTEVWRAAPVLCPEGRKGCSPAQAAAVTVIPGVVFSGSLDGHLRAYSTEDGRVIWDYDTVREFTTVNGVSGRGGALNGPGPTVAKGMLFVNSGYGYVGQMPGNVLLAFGVE